MRRLRISSSSSCILFASALAAAAHAQAPQAAVALYSDLCYHELAGDILGDRLFLINSFDTCDVVFQPAPGWTQRPWTGAAKIAGNQIQFEVKSSTAQTESFSGTISPDEIVGTFASGRTNSKDNKVIHWKRGSAENPRIPTC
jgi:hypothetical protein